MYVFFLFFVPIVISTGEKEKNRGMLRRRIQLDCWLTDWLATRRREGRKEASTDYSCFSLSLSLSPSFF
jgi:hypothetical protein